MVLERMIEIAATQLGVQEGYTLDPEIDEAVKRLSGYLQLVFTLMDTTVPSSEESKCWRKGFEKH